MKKTILVLSLSCSASFAQDSVITDSEELREITKTYITDTSRPNDFEPQGDGTVIDKRTGLQWMQCSLGQTWGKTKKGKDECTGYISMMDLYTYEQANQPLSFAGYDDWRLPTMWELETLMYCGGGKIKTNISLNAFFEDCDGDYARPVIAQSAFPNVGEGWYFTSTMSPEDDELIVVVNFEIGGVSAYPKSISKNQVRLVRQPKK